jgi:hypothetical protein
MHITSGRQGDLDLGRWYRIVRDRQLSPFLHVRGSGWPNSSKLEQLFAVSKHRKMAFELSCWCEHGLFWPLVGCLEVAFSFGRV